jgi:cytidylate kinase
MADLHHRASAHEGRGCFAWAVWCCLGWVVCFRAFWGGSATLEARRVDRSFSQIIAIDGPAASGKSTVALEVARALGCPMLNSGSLYRVVTWACLQKSVDCSDPESVAYCVSNLGLRIHQDGVECRPHLGTVPGFQNLRAPAVATQVAVVAAVPAVRRVLTALMREFAAGRQMVVEGRDIGSVVFPEARYKFFLHADPAVRQKRRVREGHGEDVQKRDAMDRSRRHSPLQVPGGAIVVDTSKISVAEVVNLVIQNVGDIP